MDIRTTQNKDFYLCKQFCAYVRRLRSSWLTCATWHINIDLLLTKETRVTFITGIPKFIFLLLPLNVLFSLVSFHEISTVFFVPAGVYFNRAAYPFNIAIVYFWNENMLSWVSAQSKASLACFSGLNSSLFKADKISERVWQSSRWDGETSKSLMESIFSKSSLT